MITSLLEKRSPKTRNIFSPFLPRRSNLWQLSFLLFPHLPFAISEIVLACSVPTMERINHVVGRSDHRRLHCTLIFPSVVHVVPFRQPLRAGETYFLLQLCMWVAQSNPISPIFLVLCNAWRSDKCIGGSKFIQGKSRDSTENKFVLWLYNFN